MKHRPYITAEWRRLLDNLVFGGMEAGIGCVCVCVCACVSGVSARTRMDVGMLVIASLCGVGMSEEGKGEDISNGGKRAQFKTGRWTGRTRDEASRDMEVRMAMENQ